MAWENGIQVPFPFFFFAWHWKTDLNFAFCFSFSTRLEKRFWTSYFVFASLWKTDMNFSFRFSFSHHFEKRIWISFFVFRFRITLKNGFEFRFSFSHHFEKQIWISFVSFPCLKKGITAPVQSFEAPPPPSGVDRGIYFRCNWKSVNFPLPGPKVSSKLPPPPDDMSHTRYSLFKQWMANDMLIAANKHAAATLAYPRWRRKMRNIWTLYNLKSQNAR